MKSDRKKAKDAAWRAFSRYIRVRDAILTTGGTEVAKCVTCGHEYPVEKLQAGHFLPGRTNGILLDERGVHAQCAGCNLYGGGAQAQYYRYMRERYGQDVIDSLVEAKLCSCKLTASDYQTLAKVYRRRTDAMLANGLVEEHWCAPFTELLAEIRGGGPVEVVQAHDRHGS